MESAEEAREHDFYGFVIDCCGIKDAVKLVGYLRESCLSDSGRKIFVREFFRNRDGGMRLERISGDNFYVEAEKLLTDEEREGISKTYGPKDLAEYLESQGKILTEFRRSLGTAPTEAEVANRWLEEHKSDSFRASYALEHPDRIQLISEMEVALAA